MTLASEQGGKGKNRVGNASEKGLRNGCGKKNEESLVT